MRVEKHGNREDGVWRTRLGAILFASLIMQWPRKVPLSSAFGERVRDDNQ
jgi:hypothetical protein